MSVFPDAFTTSPQTTPSPQPTPAHASAARRGRTQVRQAVISGVPTCLVTRSSQGLFRSTLLLEATGKTLSSGVGITRQLAEEDALSKAQVAFYDLKR